jgi:hypothetical protein
MTTKSILEQALTYAHKELNSQNPKAKFIASDTIEKIGKMVENNDPPSGPDALILCNIFKDCGITGRDEARKL